MYPYQQNPADKRTLSITTIHDSTGDDLILQAGERNIDGYTPMNFENASIHARGEASSGPSS